MRLPLLSPKPLLDFTASEFKEYVRSLYHKPVPRKSKKKPLAPFTWRRNAKGTLIIRCNRKPQWLSREEIDRIAIESGEPMNAVWLKITGKKSKIKVSSEAEEKTYVAFEKEFPW